MLQTNQLIDSTNVLTPAVTKELNSLLNPNKDEKHNDIK